MAHTIVGQTSELSCGAACLLCAAIELDSAPVIGNLAANKPLRHLIESGEPLAASNAWLTAIYDISGAGQAGYSLPSGVIVAAGYLGMTATVITAQTKTVSFLQKHYPDEMARCVDNTIPVASPKLGDLTLKQKERAMHCVRIGPTTGVHWVLQRDDNTYMDPAGGTTPLDITQGGGDRADRATLKAAGQSAFKYHGTGLAVKLTANP